MYYLRYYLRWYVSSVGLYLLVVLCCVVVLVVLDMDDLTSSSYREIMS